MYGTNVYICTCTLLYGHIEWKVCRSYGIAGNLWWGNFAISFKNNYFVVLISYQGPVASFMTLKFMWLTVSFSGNVNVLVCILLLLFGIFTCVHLNSVIIMIVCVHLTVFREYFLQSSARPRRLDFLVGNHKCPTGLPSGQPSFRTVIN